MTPQTRRHSCWTEAGRHPARRGLCLFLLCKALLLAGAAAIQAQAQAPPAAERDRAETAFREALRRRGLTDWLDQHLADSPPVSTVDGRLRHRERLLSEGAGPGIPRHVRRQKVEEARRVLSELIDQWPQHPARGEWQLELARDVLEREDPSAFDALLLHELPGKDRGAVAVLSTRCIETLQRLREDIAGTWAALEGLDERRLAEAVESGATRALESLDGQSAFLLAWAELYRLASLEDADPARAAGLDQLLETVTRRYAWTLPVPGREVQRCSALVLAAVAARLTGRTADARQYARDLQEAVPQVRDPLAREGLGKVVLLGVLEQIRAPRDAGRLDEARAVLDEARAWAGRSRPGDLAAELALAFAERSLVLKQLAAGSGNGRPPAWDAPEGLLPLQRAASHSPAARDALYELMGGMLADEPLPAGRGLFALQLYCGCVIADTATAGPGPAPERIRPVMAALAEALRPLPALVPGDLRGELMLLRARACYLDGALLEAVRVLCDLVEQHPQHDRSGTAAEQAAAIAQEAMRRQGAAPEPARAAFVRAGRLVRERQPDSPLARQLQYFIAAALDEGRQFEEAAEEYAAVSPGDPRALRAAWGQARCLRDALYAAPATRPADGAANRRLAERALEAGRAAVQRAGREKEADACLRADTALVFASLLNHPLINRPEEAVQTLEDFEARYPGCPAAAAPMLRERVTSFRLLKRMAEARAVVEQVLEADPHNAGSLMARLLDAMREEMAEAAGRGDEAAARSVATEASQLASRLQAWALAHPGRLAGAELLTLAVWEAAATLEAGEAERALALYEQVHRGEPGSVPAGSPLHHEIRLGRAECLLRLGRPADALPLFDSTWRDSPERSPAWWRAYVGTLQAHSALGHDPAGIVQSIRQQRLLAPGLGGPRWQRALERLERQNAGGAATAPAP